MDHAPPGRRNRDGASFQFCGPWREGFSLPFSPVGSPKTFGTTRKALEHLWNKIDHLKGNCGSFPGVRATESTRFMERAMGIEPIANSLSPVESVGLTLLEARIWAQKRGILRPSCAQIYPSPKSLGDGIEAQKLVRTWSQLRSALCRPNFACWKRVLAILKAVLSVNRSRRF